MRFMRPGESDGNPTERRHIELARRRVLSGKHHIQGCMAVKKESVRARKRKCEGGKRDKGAKRKVK